LDITGLDSTYDTYAIGVSDMRPATNDVRAFLRMGDSGGVDSGASDYSWGNAHIIMDSTSGGVTIAEDNADTQISLQHTVDGTGNDSDEGFGCMVFLHRPGDGTMVPSISGTFMSQNTTTLGVGGWCTGQRNSVITLDRIQVLFSSGNITSGRLTVWGIKHA
jgi:hypothetical protein